MINKKYFSLLVALLFIGLILPTVYAGVQLDDDEGYIIDQMQTDEGGWYAAINNEKAAAQSFIPTMTPLAKVRLYIRSNNPENPSESYPLKISIRKQLTGEDLTAITVEKTHVLDEYAWINFDFQDITVQPGDTYYIVAETTTSVGEYRWGMWSSQDIEKYDHGEAWIRNIINGIPQWVNFEDECNDCCFKTYGYAGKESDLQCSGIIGLPDQQPGSIVQAEFCVENCGEPESLLNWHVVSYPSWGTWTFSPSEGIDLMPEDDAQMVTVTIEVPDENNTDYHGEIVLGNMNDANDTESIRVTLSTPSHYRFSELPSLIRLMLQRFPFFSFFF